MRPTVERCVTFDAGICRDEPSSSTMLPEGCSVENTAFTPLHMPRFLSAERHRARQRADGSF